MGYIWLGVNLRWIMQSVILGLTDQSLLPPLKEAASFLWQKIFLPFVRRPTPTKLDDEENCLAAAKE